MSAISRRTFIQAVGIGSAAVALPAAATKASTASAATPAVAGASKGGLRATVDPQGNWQVVEPRLGWTFAGTIGVPAEQIRTRSGKDQLGKYQETSFRYQSGGAKRATIKTYDASSVVIFTHTYVDAAANDTAFPTFASYPKLSRTLSHHDCFGVYQFNSFNGAADSPWAFFDDQGNTFMLSAANHVQQAETTMGSDGSIAAGVLTSIEDLPAGFNRQTVLAIGCGIGAAYRAWGSTLTALTGKSLPANDSGIILDKLGYWTDHGATYYYTYDNSLGYTGTLLAVSDEWAAKKIPLCYMQLDSWWYPKGPQADWTDLADGAYLYEAAPELFPDGLAAFQKQLGVPLAVHARWINASSPYRTEFAMSGDVCVDPKFWRQVMDYLRESGVVVYEQDWLCEGAQPEYNLVDPDEYFGDMAESAGNDGLDIQYCMPLPRDYLQSAQYDNLTTMRVSDDRFDSSKWDNFLYDSQLAGAVGVWPWCDVFMSGETTNLLLATLSAGPVGVGDAIGDESAENLFQVVRPDGVIVKPDTPIVPTDSTYVSEAAGQQPAMIAATQVDHAAGLRYGYVFAYARQTPPPQDTYLAAAATLSGVVIAQDNPGYTGTGYGDYQHSSGDYMEWAIHAPTAGTYTLGFRYANGDSGNRPLAVAVNGAAVATLPFAPTGSWTRWLVQGVSVQLAAGANTVRATDTGNSGANVDYLGVSQGQVPTVPTQTASLTLSELEIDTSAYAFDYFAGTGTLVPRGGTITGTVTDGTYWVVAPVGRSGIAFLGDAGKFVAHGRKRIVAVNDSGALRVTVSFAEGEDAVTLRGHARRRPKMVVGAGHGGDIDYDSSSGLFTFTVTNTRDRQATVTVVP